VVTDDNGRFLVPDLPAATYSVFVRGYGLVDSPRMQLKPSTTAVTLKATTAKTPQEAAKVYPGKLLAVAAAAARQVAVPGHRRTGQWRGRAMLTPEPLDQLAEVRLQLLPSARQPAHAQHRSHLQSEAGAEDACRSVGMAPRHRRARHGDVFGADQSGQGAFAEGVLRLDRAHRERRSAARTAASQGVERNVVVTLWDVGTDHSFMHDEVSTSKQKPTTNGGGAVYAVSAGHGTLVVLDPEAEHDRGARDSGARAARNRAVALPEAEPPVAVVGRPVALVESAVQPRRSAQPDDGQQGSRVDDVEDPAAMQDPAWCNDGKSAYSDWYPLRGSGRQTSYYDPKTKQFTLIDTCYATHHLQFDNDPDETVYFNELSGPIFGWVNTKVFDTAYNKALSGDARQDQGRTDRRAAGGRLVRSGRRHQRRREDHAAVERHRRTRRGLGVVRGDTQGRWTGGSRRRTLQAVDRQDRIRSWTRW
jgi:hypothetical protein